MAFAVTEFKSALKQGGARSSLFNVEFQYPRTLTARPNPPNQASFLVKATTIPASTCLLYTSQSTRDLSTYRMRSSA